MMTLSFSIEIQAVGQSCNCMAVAIQSVVGGTVEHVGRPCWQDAYEVLAEDGRCWRVVADSSLHGNKEHQAEIVSPLLNSEDIPTLQKVVGAVRGAGARVNESCGIHVYESGLTRTAVSH